jgi:hypothetical protein
MLAVVLVLAALIIVALTGAENLSRKAARIQE